MNEPDRPGALVISLDFELHWGVRDHVGRHDAPYGRLTEERRAVADLVERVRFAEHPCHLGHRRLPVRLEPW